MAVEQEMKVPVADLDDVRSRLATSGAVLRHPLAFEENWVLDDGAGSLRGSGRLLRLRRLGDEWIITFKGPASFAAGIKSRPEFETGVAAGERLLEILAGLGFAPVRRYQKRRETWVLSGLAVSLDETPMGSFVELEGDPTVIVSVASRLDLDPQRAARGSYLDLWLAWRENHAEAPVDMVFS
ncbi:MAG: class IV adenylate cyclase [Acidobacteriota bacterium]